MDEHEAVAALEDLGLTSYEAKTFIALQRLGSGGAREVAEVSDVPRPQVYSTAESLERRGLIDVQQSNPIRYRPVTTEEAKTRLRNQFERTQETAFEYIENVRTEGTEHEQQEDIWTVSGRETITDRIVHLARGAQREILFGVQSASLVDAETIAALRQATAAGVSITVISRDPSLCELFEESDDITVVEPAIEDREEATGRLLVVDEQSVLLSAFSDDAPDGHSETAIWSSETRFARLLVRLIRSHLQA